MKRLISLVLSLVLLLSLFPVSLPVAAKTEGVYSYIQDGDITEITRVDAFVSGVVNIPTHLGGYPVTCISAGAFNGCNLVTEVQFPNTVTHIYDAVFSDCTALRKVTIPESVTYLGSAVFKGCTALEEAVIYGEVSILWRDMFEGCTALKRVSLPVGLQRIAEDSFHNCSSLTEIEIPITVTEIAGGAFSGCNRLQKMILPWPTITAVGVYDSFFAALFGASAAVGGENYVPTSLQTVVITRADYLPGGAFLDLRGIKEIVLPEGLCSIGGRAFARTSIAAITIPSSVYDVGNAAFEECTSLETARINEGLSYLSVGMFSKCQKLKTVYLPYSVTFVDVDAFWMCNSLQTVHYSGSASDKERIIYIVGINANNAALNRCKWNYHNHTPTTATCWDPSVCLECGMVVQYALGHDYDVFRTEEGHWKDCTRCNRVTMLTPHIYWDETNRCCYECGYTRPLASPKVKASAGSEWNDVSWDYVLEADKYYVYRQSNRGSGWSDWQYMGSVSGGYYPDTKAKAGVKYRYGVRSVDTYGSSNMSKSCIVMTLSTPKAKVSNATKGIKVSWGKVTGATHYRVYRRTYANGKWSSWTRIKSTSSTSYTDTKAKTGKNYRYMVKAVNGSVTSDYKSTSTIRRLKASSSIKLKKASKGFKVTWSKATSAKTYELYRRTGSGSWKKVKTTTGRSYTDKTAKKGKYYTYRVRAVNGSSKSVFKTSKKTKR